jgi:SAM-dependent methyltransferase
MRAATAASLLEINRDFYARFGDSFSATRHRIQPGVHRVLKMLAGEESVLDLGCGNGELARELGRRGHRGPYLGVDFSPPLLQEARIQPEKFSAKFIQADLTLLPYKEMISALNDRRTAADGWNIITAFAVLHHIPSKEIRLDILRTVQRLLAEEGRFVLSNWQFLSSEKLKTRIKPWKEAAIRESDVEAGDYLLDWRSGGAGLRYVHHFTESELSVLAQESGFVVRETFYSDGVTGNLGLYQIWENDSRH